MSSSTRCESPMASPSIQASGINLLPLCSLPSLLGEKVADITTLTATMTNAMTFFDIGNSLEKEVHLVVITQRLWIDFFKCHLRPMQMASGVAHINTDRA